MSKIPFERLIEIAEGSAPATAEEKHLLAEDPATARELEELTSLLEDTRSIDLPPNAFKGMEEILPNVMQEIDNRRRFNIFKFLPAPRQAMAMAASIVAVVFIYFAIFAVTPSSPNQPFSYLASYGDGIEEIIYPYSSMELIASNSNYDDTEFKTLVDSESLESYQYLNTMESDYQVYDEISTLEDDNFKSLIEELDEK